MVLLFSQLIKVKVLGHFLHEKLNFGNGRREVVHIFSIRKSEKYGASFKAQEECPISEISARAKLLA